MPRTLDAELIIDVRAELAESPAWDPDTGRLVWVNIEAGEVHADGPDGAAPGPATTIGRPVGSAMPAPAGQLLLAAREGFCLLSAEGQLTPLVNVLNGRTDMRFNDAKCDPWGRAFGGTMPYGVTPGKAALFRLDPGPVAVPVVQRLGLANGMGWSPDGSAMYLIDTMAGSVQRYAYDPATGEVGTGRPVITVPRAEGKPDGMCVDDDGCLWVAIYGSGQVRRYQPDGTLDTVVGVPATQVTCCAFGGADGTQLFITTAAQDLSAYERAAQPLAGGIFAVTPGTTGPHATPWQPVQGTPAQPADQ